MTEKSRQKRPSGDAGGTHVVRKRLVLMLVFFGAGFALILARLVDFAIWPNGVQATSSLGANRAHRSRPNILDRRGRILATDIHTASLFADTRKMIDIDEAVEQLSPLLPSLSSRELRRRLSKRRAFVWIKRELSPRQEAAIHNLGIPGLGFVGESRRVYPTGATASHILGHVNVDNQGIAGVEKYLDATLSRRAVGGPAGRPRAPVRLAMDLRVQHALRDELDAARVAFKAKGAAGIVMNVTTGEIVAMSSLPDYNPNKPVQALDKSRLNKTLVGVYELGSTLKVVNTAMALDLGVARLNSRFDARVPLRVKNHTIHDFHPQRRILTVEEIFIHSSNIGSARMAMKVGLDRQKRFLKKLGFLRRIKTELPESARPIYPRKWQPLHGMTIAFGHGLSITPLHLAAAAAALVNGGLYVPPTFVRRDPIEAIQLVRRVIKPETSATIRYLMRLNVEKGTARKAKVEGIEVGGKTGTAEKIVKGRYSKRNLLTSFLGMFPTDRPKYVLLVMLDEPRPNEHTHGHATAGWNAVPTAGKVIKRIAPLLGVFPKQRDKDQDDGIARLLKRPPSRLN